MLLIGCDFHTRCQQIAMAQDSTGDVIDASTKRIIATLEDETGKASPKRKVTAS